MIRRIVLLAVVLAALAWWDRALSRTEVRERAQHGRVGRLIPAEERASMPIAAVRLEIRGRTHLYGRQAGSWRCLSTLAAPADGEGLELLIGKLSNAEGRVQSDDLARAEAYGIATSETVRVSLCGPNVLSDPRGDVLWAVDVGRAHADGGGAFVRVLGSREVWSIDADPHPELARRNQPHLPPLLDPTLVTRAWPGLEKGLRRVRVEGGDGGVLELERRDLPRTPEELREGALPFEWILDADGEGGEGGQGGEALPCDPRLSVAFVAFLLSAPYVDVLDPARAAELGLDRPGARVTLFPGEGAPLELRLGTPLEDGRVPVRNSHTTALLAVSPEVARLLQPAREELLDPELANPWEPYAGR